MVTKVEKIVCQVHATAAGGRDGSVNPEQLFAAGYSACLIGAVKFVAGKQKIPMPPDASINATVGIGQIHAGLASRCNWW